MFNRERRLSQNRNLTWAFIRYEAFHREWAFIDLLYFLCGAKDLFIPGEPSWRESSQWNEASRGESALERTVLGRTGDGRIVQITLLLHELLCNVIMTVLFSITTVFRYSIQWSLHNFADGNLCHPFWVTLQ